MFKYIVLEKVQRGKPKDTSYVEASLHISLEHSSSDPSYFTIGARSG